MMTGKNLICLGRSALALSSLIPLLIVLVGRAALAVVAVALHVRRRQAL